MIKSYKKYINGDYVRLTPETLDYMNLYPIVKILRKRTLKTYDSRGQSLYYTVEGINSKSVKIEKHDFNYEELKFSKERLATQEEIDEYEFLKSVNNYNL